MKIMVCASIGYGGINKIRELYSKLSKAGFEVLNHIDEKQMDYSNVKDFREQKELAKKIVEHGFWNGKTVWDYAVEHARYRFLN